MKTTFYKKLVPLAMIASLAVSGAGALGAQTGLADLISANAIVAYADDASTATVTTTDAAVAFVYDILDADTATATATVKIAATKPAPTDDDENAKIAAKASDLDTAKFSVKNTAGAVTGFTFAVEDAEDDSIAVKITAAKSVAEAGTELYYDATKIGTVTSTSGTLTATDEAKGTHVDGTTLKKYDGASTEIDLSKASNITTIGKDAFNGTAITSVKLGSVTTIEGGAFAGCSSLVTIEIPAGLDSITLGTPTTTDGVTTVTKAFGEDPNQYLTAVGTNVNADVKAAFEAEGVEVLDLAVAADAGNTISAPAGEVLKLISENGAVIGSNGTAKVAISSPESEYYEKDGNFNFSDIENPSWNLINPSTGKPAAAAKFGAGKKYTKTTASGETLLIGGTKANGKFNNYVLLSTSVNQPKVDEDGILLTGKKAETKDGKTTYVDNKDADGKIIDTQIKSTFDAGTAGTYIAAAEKTMTADDYNDLVAAVEELKDLKEKADAAKTAAETAQKDAQAAFNTKMTEIYGGTEYNADPTSGLYATKKAADTKADEAQEIALTALETINSMISTARDFNTDYATDTETFEAEIDALKARMGTDPTEFEAAKTSYKNSISNCKKAGADQDTATANYQKACKELADKTDITNKDQITNATAGLAGKLNTANADLTAKTTAAKTATENYDALNEIKTAVEAQKSDVKVSAEVKIYITPATPTTWIASTLKDKNPKGVNFKAGTTEAPAPEGCDYVLEIEEGKSFSIPFKLKDGADKTLNYSSTNNGHFSINAKGKVTAIASNCTVGTDDKIVPDTDAIDFITVKSVADNTVSKKVAVYVKPAVTKTYTNTNSLAIVADQEATLTLGTVPASEKAVSYTVTVPDGYTATYTDGTNSGNVTSDTAFSATGAVKLSVKDADGKEIAKTADLKVKAGDAKEVTVKLKGADSYQNVKAFKESGKKDKTTGYRVVNMVAGATYNLGLSVTPATADSKYTLDLLDMEDGYGEGTVNIDGDSVSIDEPGTYYVQATANGQSQVKKEKVQSSIFQINVYAPTESLTFGTVEEDEVGYTIQGGYLMATTNAEGECKKEFTPGQCIYPNIKIPGSEPITWKSSKPAVVPVWTDEESGTLGIGLFGSGTFTITGTTQYTKQKYTFKVAVDKWVDPSLKPKANEITTGQNCIIATSGVNEENVMYLKDKGQLSLNLDNELAAKSVKFESDKKEIVSVTNAGVITAKGVGKATITAKITGDKDKKVNGGTAPEFTTAKFEIEVKAKPIISNVKVAATAVKGADFKVSAKMANAPKDAVLKWYYATDKNGTGANTLSVEKNKTKIATAGTYWVYPSYDGQPNPDHAQMITICDVAPASVTIDAVAKTFAKGFEKADTKTAEATVIVAGKKGETATITPAEIDWVSSNSNIAWVESSTKGTGDNDKYATVKIGMEPALAGKNGTKVTLTGTLRNGGKKVKITVYVGKQANAPKPAPTEAPTSADADANK